MYDSIIIGSGIAGITAAIYLKRANKKILLLERKVPGGQIIKTSRIENYPGFVGDGATFASKLVEQLEKLNIEITYDNVIEIKNDDNEKTVVTEQNQYKTKTIIIATGREAKKNNFENESELVGHGVSYCATCDGIFYKGMPVAVQGGGNSALEEALFLSNIASSVTIIHRRDEFTADQYLIEEIKKHDNIKILFNTTIKGLKQDKENLSGILLDNGEVLDVKGLFIYIGLIPSTYFLEKIGIEMDKGYVIVDNKMQTNIKGIYACGDIIKKDIYQLVTAASEGATSALNAIKYIKEL